MNPNEQPNAKTDSKEELNLDELDKASGGLPSNSDQHTVDQTKITFTFRKINVENLTPSKSVPDDWDH